MATDTVTRPTADTVAPGRTGVPITAWVLRQQRRAIAGWALALAAVSAIYVGFWPAMGGAELDELVAGLPEELVDGLGYGAIGTPAGYLESTVFSLLAPALLLVFAIGFGARAVGGQEEDGTLELELTMPVARSRVLAERFLALVVQLTVLATVVLVVVTGMVAALDMDVAVGNIAAAALGLFLLALAMGTISLAVGAATGCKAYGLAAGAGLAVTSFMANVLAPLLDGAAWLENVSPFAWYLGGDPLTEGIAVAGFGGLLAITLVALAIATPLFGRRDLGV